MQGEMMGQLYTLIDDCCVIRFREKIESTRMGAESGGTRKTRKGLAQKGAKGAKNTKRTADYADNAAGGDGWAEGD